MLLDIGPAIAPQPAAIPYFNLTDEPPDVRTSPISTTDVSPSQFRADRCGSSQFFRLRRGYSTPFHMERKPIAEPQPRFPEELECQSARRRRIILALGVKSRHLAGEAIPL